jgi:hypothetical protein
LKHTNVEDEIEALLTGTPIEKQAPMDLQRRATKNKHHDSILEDVDDELLNLDVTNRRPAEVRPNIRAVSANKDGLKNVYALSEAMEPLRVVETPVSRLQERPRTAGDTPSPHGRRTGAPPDILALDDHNVHNSDEQMVCIYDLFHFKLMQMHGHSIPMLFKPSNDTNKRKLVHRRRKKFESGAFTLY